MIRYLKYIILGFGGIALGIAIFFYMQNKNDIHLFLDYKSKLDYETISRNCPIAEDKYFYPCFKPLFEELLSHVSLTGSSMGLKLAFNFIDDDKMYTTKFSSDNDKDIFYSLNYIELNNIVIRSSFHNYRGMEKLYSGFIISLERFNKKAFEFSENLIIGLEGDNGYLKISDQKLKKEVMLRLKKLKHDFSEAKFESRKFIEDERRKYAPHSES